MIISIISIILIALGLLFFLGTGIGLLRFPDFYTRMHAAGKGDTLSTILILFGVSLYNLEHFTLAALLVSIKILLICFFIFIGSPTATHAIMHAGYASRVKPWQKPGTPAKEGEEQ